MILLAAIARDEGRGIVEWLAHHLALGFDRIVVYDHASVDDMPQKLDALTEAGYPVERLRWEVADNESPQMTAYADAIVRFRDVEWLALFDVDEFLVLAEGELKPWLRGFPPEISGIGVNWLTFGSSGLGGPDYELVRDAFRHGPHREHGNNKHVKSFVRPSRVAKMHSHAALLTSGTYARPDGSPLPMSETIGIADSVDHNVAQLHHYQLKSRAEFEAKIARGRAGKRMNDQLRIRENPEVIWRKLDKMDCRYDDIDRGREAFEAMYRKLSAVAGR